MNLENLKGIMDMENGVTDQFIGLIKDPDVPNAYAAVVLGKKNKVMIHYLTTELLEELGKTENGYRMASSVVDHEKVGFGGIDSIVFSGVYMDKLLEKGDADSFDRLEKLIYKAMESGRGSSKYEPTVKDSVPGEKIKEAYKPAQKAPEAKTDIKTGAPKVEPKAEPYSPEAPKATPVLNDDQIAKWAEGKTYKHK